jgi:cytochrome c oxidase cbb3-type subunit 3
MNRRAIHVAYTLTLLLALAGCANSRGVPRSDSANIPPNQIMEFSVLYGQNCAGCHGADGKGGAVIALANPVFLAIADDNVIRQTASRGVHGTPMPAFAQSEGGMLTDKQIEALVQGIRSWAKPDSFRETTLPSYAAQGAGDPQRGATAYQTFCSSCHGQDGRGGKASSIVDGSYLALVSNQQLRTIVIAGRPELNAPDWRNDVEGRPMSPQEISDVVAWLASKRTAIPGQPYPNSTMGQATGGNPGGIR